MTELKIKQADINNNGNQRLMGEIGGRCETENMYRVRLWVYACVQAGEWRVGIHGVLFLLFYFLEICEI